MSLGLPGFVWSTTIGSKGTRSFSPTFPWGILPRLCSLHCSNRLLFSFVCPCQRNAFIHWQIVRWRHLYRIKNDLFGGQKYFVSKCKKWSSGASFLTQLAILYLRLVGAIFSPVGADDDDCNSVTIPSPPPTRLKNVESNQQMHSFYAQSLAKVL